MGTVHRRTTDGSRGPGPDGDPPPDSQDTRTVSTTWKLNTSTQRSTRAPVLEYTRTCSDTHRQGVRDQGHGVRVYT